MHTQAASPVFVDDSHSGSVFLGRKQTPTSLDIRRCKPRVLQYERAHVQASGPHPVHSPQSSAATSSAPASCVLFARRAWVYREGYDKRVIPDMV